ncbi:MAG: hypothetical protein H7Y20_18070 [Bryobacteraceae bacterium]|nr:hypothetical protein [Bryobacteraceae bacterium]
MNDVSSIISQLEQQKASIDRALDALREITGVAAPRKPLASASAPISANKSQTERITAGGRRKLSESTKRRWAAKQTSVKETKQSTAGKGSTATKEGSLSKGRTLTTEQKRAISNAWTPERKQKFAEFHVQRMARERGEDPAKALREYRRRKQKEQAGATTAARTSPKVGAKKAAAETVSTAAA